VAITQPERLESELKQINNKDLKFDGKTVIIVIFYLGLFLHHVFTFCPRRLHRAGSGGARPADQLAAAAARLACRAAVVGASRGRALGCRCTQATARWCDGRDTRRREMSATRPWISGDMGPGTGRPRRCWMTGEDEERLAMVLLTGKERKVRETMNEHGFEKRIACRCRG